jgi:hypothetical protein
VGLSIAFLWFSIRSIYFCRTITSFITFCFICVVRTDYSRELAAAARHGFAVNIARGESGVRLAEAALLISAEDDAIGG